MMRQPDQVRFHRRAEYVELGEEAAGHRNADEREQENSQRGRQQRRTAPQAFVIFQQLRNVRRRWRSG